MKHGDAMDMTGNWNPGRNAEFSRAVHQFINDPTVLPIAGEYRGNPAIINYNPATGVAVFETPAGQYVTTFRLTDRQMASFFNSGKVK
jgi:hypothetical protein